MQNFLNLFINYTPWIANFLFFIAIIPQIVLNHKMKSTSGLSDLLLIGYLNGYITTLYYCFCLDLPMAYKILVPIAAIALIIMIIQRFYYADFQKKDTLLLGIYFLNLGLAIGILPYTLKNPIFIGNIAGYFMALIWATYQLPQVVKIFLEKSVLGVSFSLIALVTLGNFLELIAAIYLNLPVQTILNDLRAILIFIIFVIQFKIYPKNKPF